MKKSSYVQCIATCCMFLSCSLALHAETADGKIGVVEMNRILTNSIVGKALVATLGDEANKRQATLKVRRSEIERERAEIEKQAALLSASALDDKKAALQKKEKDYTRDVQDERDEFLRKKNAGIEKIVVQAQSVINQLAKQEHYKFIIERDPRVVIYSRSELDLTDEVIKALDNAKLNS